MRIRSKFHRLRTYLGTRQGWPAAGKVVLLIGIGMFIAWLILPSGRRGAPTDKPARLVAAKDNRAAEMWICSMHPSEQKPGPGKCRICGMDLIPMSTGGAALTSLRQLELSPAARELMSIQVRPVERRFVTAEVRMVGKVEYDETRLRRIAAWTPGRLDRLYVDYTGIEVREGDHMVYIYSPELYSAQQELIQALRLARERGPEAARRTSTGNDLVESTREKLRLLGLTEEQIAEIERQNRPTSHLTIYAPIGGIVIEKLKKEGDYVQTGEQIYTVADLSQVWVQLDAYESDLVWLRYGQDVTFTTEAYPGEEFHGRISFIDPILDDRKRTVKVRVNVANPEGKLKPSMFVRGVARSEIAGGGRVIDAELAGKWISPMHPEIVKDGPGECDICGMDLVPAESLGYVSSEELLTDPPMVIPVSAVLWTGTRAIVYVELPDTEQPTFEGREIVLGPRAGDYYLVRGGLEEGELVVTRGNFKIDSALQIQARPSMMTPEGGGAVAHHHDHGAPAATAEQPPTDAMMEVPAEFLAQLRQVEIAYEQVRQAVDEENLARIREAYRRLGQAVDAVDVELVREHAAMLWRELRMLLANDAIEGQEAVNLETARRIAQKSARTIERLREQLIAPQQEHLGHGEHLVQRIDVPAQFASQVGDVLESYFALRTALAGDDLDGARQAVDDLRSSAWRVQDEELLAEPALHAWHEQHGRLSRILDSLDGHDELTPLRTEFSSLSREMETMVHRFGAGLAGPVYRVFCSMALENQGAWWLQQTDDIRNPYFGASMLKCHDRFEKIASGPTAEPPGHADE